MTPKPDDYLRVRWDLAGFRSRVLKTSASAIARMLGVTQPAVTNAEVRGYTSLLWYKALYAEVNIDEESTIKVFEGRQPSTPTPQVLALAKRFDTKHPAVRFVLPAVAAATPVPGRRRRRGAVEAAVEPVAEPRSRGPLAALPRTVPQGIDSRRLDLVINHRRKGYPEQAILQHYIWEGGIKEFKRYLELAYDWYPELRPAASRVDSEPTSAEEAVEVLSTLLGNAAQRRAVLEAKVERLEGEVRAARERAENAEAAEARAVMARQEIERELATLRESMNEAVQQRDEALTLSEPAPVGVEASPEAVAFIEKHAPPAGAKHLLEELAALPKSKGRRR